MSFMGIETTGFVALKKPAVSKERTAINKTKNLVFIAGSV